MSGFDTKVKAQSNPHFPFVREKDGTGSVVRIVAAEVYKIYEPIFIEYAIDGDGNSWNDMVIHALAQQQAALGDKIDFGSDSRSCVMRLASTADAQALVNTLQPVFSDEKRFRALLDTFDTNVLDDF